MATPLTNKLHNCGLTDFSKKPFGWIMNDSQGAKKNYEII